MSPASPSTTRRYLPRLELNAARRRLLQPAYPCPHPRSTPTQIQRSVHAVLGPWIAYRAVVVFPGIRPDASQLPRPAPPVDPCSAAEWDRVRALQDACFAKWAPDNPDGSKEDWARLVEVVEAFEAGREHAYSADQLTFHYGGHNEPARIEHLRSCAMRAE